MTVVTRFAPSPTGKLHVGNVRTALVNWLFARKHQGQFMLRMDDTDQERSREEYAHAIQQDLGWLGLEWDRFAKQSERLERYEEVKQQLIEQGRLYPCYESQEELAVKRKMLLNRGLPPIYDRAALALTDEQKAAFEAEGKKPHYRFKLNDAPISWDDMVRGTLHFEGKHLSDPILIRENGTMTYTLCSVVDDIDYGITHIIRGEDHISNSAMHTQIFEALGASSPVFAHVALLKGKDAEMSKRLGGFDVESLRNKHIEAMPITSLLAKIGTSDAIEIAADLNELIKNFDISKFGKAAAHYDEEELDRLNHRYLASVPFDTIEPQLKKVGANDVDASFWQAIAPNLTRVTDVIEWQDICCKPLAPIISDDETAGFLQTASELLPETEWDTSTWGQWISRLKDTTGRKGKNLFMPLRLALTARTSGPELGDLLPLLGREKVIGRLNGKAI